MTAFYIILKVSALLAIILFPLVGPIKKKIKSLDGLSRISVNESGYLEYFNNFPSGHHPVN